MPFYISALGLDVIVTLWDCFVVDYADKISVPMMHYLPIDAPFTLNMYNYVKDAYRIIAYSRFGFNQLINWRYGEFFIPPAKIEYIPHGCNTTIFKPCSKNERKQVRENLLKEPEDSLLLVTVAANIGERKCLPQLMLIFKKLLKTVPNAYLYLFTNPIIAFPKGYDLRGFAQQLGILDHIIFPSKDIALIPAEDRDLAMLLSSCDLYVTASMGEGFGLPLIESMACETPCIAPNNSSHTELIEGHGFLVECISTDLWVDVPVWVPTLQEYPVVNMQKFLSTLQNACANEDLRKEYGRLGREFVVKNYDWEKGRIINKWVDLFLKVEDELKMLKAMIST